MFSSSAAVCHYTDSDRKMCLVMIGIDERVSWDIRRAGNININMTLMMTKQHGPN